MTNQAYQALQARREANARFDAQHQDWLVSGQWQRMARPSWTRQQPAAKPMNLDALIARAAKEVRVRP